jgi:hypothetical protein
MACHFLKDKKISIPLRRRFQFCFLSAFSGFTTELQGPAPLGQRVRALCVCNSEPEETFRFRSTDYHEIRAGSSSARSCRKK